MTEVSVMIDEALDIFGTADLIATKGDTLIIGDLKTGGNPISAYYNKQLMLYARGLITKEYKHIELVIVQNGKLNTWKTNYDIIMFETQSMLDIVANAKKGIHTINLSTQCDTCEFFYKCDKVREIIEWI